MPKRQGDGPPLSDAALRRALSPDEFFVVTIEQTLPLLGGVVIGLLAGGTTDSLGFGWTITIIALLLVLFAIEFWLIRVWRNLLSERAAVRTAAEQRAMVRQEVRRDPRVERRIARMRKCVRSAKSGPVSSDSGRDVS